MDYSRIRDRVDQVEGYMIPGQEKFLFDKVRSLPEDAVILEIGAFKGRSTVAMGYACVGTNRKIYSVDIWFDFWSEEYPDLCDRNFLSIWEDNICRNGLRDYAIPLRGISHDVLSRWKVLTGGIPVDFAFIDGSHRYPDVLRDFILACGIVKKSGWIALHDVVETWPGPFLMWHDIAKHLLTNREYVTTLACGQKSSPFPSLLPIHFVTEGSMTDPAVRRLAEIYQTLPFLWHWHVGGKGTTIPQLSNVHEDYLLWQMDKDELWTTEQICTACFLFSWYEEKKALSCLSSYLLEDRLKGRLPKRRFVPFRDLERPRLLSKIFSPLFSSHRPRIRKIVARNEGI